MTEQDDWKFDIGFLSDRTLAVETFASCIPDRRFRRLTQEQLIELREAINSALREYPLPQK